MDHKLEVVLLLTVGLALASLLGALAQRIKLPSVLGFLTAGYIIGPYSPGFVADLLMAEQLAEIGVILMLFGVGLHFRIQDLINVRKIAIPGAVGQTFIAAIAGTLFVYGMGWPIENGIIIGLAISVASTVVLVRVLSENRLLESLQGHIAIGWLVVEDLLTIIMLVLLPVFAQISTDVTISWLSIFGSISYFLIKFAVLVFVVLVWGNKIVGACLTSVARLRSDELFTLTLLALTFVIATGAALLFDTSIALGAFFAGMVIGQTDVRHQAFATSLPLKDLFAVIFFLSIGMLFDPATVMNYFGLFSGLLGIILVVKPIAAYLIVRVLRYPATVGKTIAIALAQIGEFSFILAEQATHWKLLPDAGYDVLVACAFVSISLNPLLFRWMVWIDERRLKIRQLSTDQYPEKIAHLFEETVQPTSKAIVVGFGPIGEAVTRALEECEAEVLVLENNIDALAKMKEEARRVIYGDASVPNILQVSEIAKARLLVITVPLLATTISIIKSARYLNPSLPIIARITYATELAQIQELDVEYVCAEEETAKAFAARAAKLFTAC